MALIEQQYSPAGPIDPKQIHSEWDYDDEAAIKLVVQDAAYGDVYLSQKQWPLRWKEIDVLYQSPRPISTWEGTTVGSANVTSFTIAKHVNSIIPQVVNGIFYENPPFVIRPRPGTDQDLVRAKTAVFSEQFEEMGFKQEVRRGWLSCLLFGTMIFKRGWLNQTRKETHYVRKEQPQKVETKFQTITVPTKRSQEFEARDIEHNCSRPMFECIDLNHVKVDPGCKVSDIRQAKWVIHEMYLTYKDFVALRDDPGWNIPDDATLRSWWEPPKEQPKLPGQTETSAANLTIVAHAAPRWDETTKDPMEQPLLVQERWDNDKVICVVQKKKCIRNEANPWGEIPFYSSGWWEIPNSFYGMGVGLLTAQEQRVEQGVTNGALNILGMQLEPTVIRSRGANVPAQNIRMRRGGIIDVDGDVDKAFKLLETGKIPAEVWEVLQNSRNVAESTTGADQLLTQGTTTGPRTSMGRTAGGANILAGASSSRLQDPVDSFCEQVLIPFVYDMDEMNNERLDPEQIKKIVGDAFGDDVAEQVDVGDYFNMKQKYEVLAGSRMAAKNAMKQIIPLLFQLLDNQEILQQLQQMGYTLDVHELISMLMEISEWKNQRNLIRKQTQEEKQNIAQANKEQQKIQGQMQLNAQKGQIQQAGKTQANNEKAEAEQARLVVEHALEEARGAGVMQ